MFSLKEYGIKLKPKYIVYFYAEANDMHELKIEKDTFLANYLGNFNQNLLENQNEINTFFNEYNKVAYKFLQKKYFSKQNNRQRKRN